MSSEDRFGDEPSMAEILASVRRIVSDDKLPNGNSSQKIVPKTETTTEQTSVTLGEDSGEDFSNRNDILQRLLRKQADLELRNDTLTETPTAPTAPITLSADPAAALSFNPTSSKAACTSVTQPSPIEPIFAETLASNEPKTDLASKIDTELNSDEIEILDLVNPIKPKEAAQLIEDQAKKQQPEEETKTDEPKLETTIPETPIVKSSGKKATPDQPDLNLAIQEWAEGSGNALLRKMIREEIASVFKQSFKD